MPFGALRGTTRGGANSITNPQTTNNGANYVVGIGDLIVAILAQQTDLTVTAVTDNLGNSYSPITAGTDAGAITARGFFSLVTVAGTITIGGHNFTTTGSTLDCACITAGWEGPFVSSPLDANPTVNTGDVTSPFAAPATGTLAQADELVVCYFACGGGSGSYLCTSPLLKIDQHSQSANCIICLGYKVVTVTTTTTPEFTGTNPTSSIVGTNSFKKDYTHWIRPPKSQILQPILAQ